ncbi:MAG: thiamine pyrophosphate-dependent enzyme [Patescibacteria group bacterium]
MTDLSFPKCWKIKTKPHKFCPGCGHPITLKALGWAIDELGLQDTAVIGFDIGCSLLAWDFFDVDSFQTHHGRTLPVMTGFKMADPSKICIAYVGDGGAYAIGAQHLVNTALRHDNITVIVVNNTNYGMTGGQEAPTTLPGEITTTTPTGADDNFIRGPEMVAAALAKEGDYIARGSVDNPLQLKKFFINALKTQIANKGFSMVESLSVCPNNWRTDAKETFDKLNKNKLCYPIKEFYTSR